MFVQLHTLPPCPRSYRGLLKQGWPGNGSMMKWMQCNCWARSHLDQTSNPFQWTSFRYCFINNCLLLLLYIWIYPQGGFYILAIGLMASLLSMAIECLKGRHKTRRITERQMEVGVKSQLDWLLSCLATTLIYRDRLQRMRFKLMWSLNRPYQMADGELTWARTNLTVLHLLH